MNISVLKDHPDVPRQIIKLSDYQQKAGFTSHSLTQAKGFSKEDARYHSVAALIVTSLEPRRAGVVARKLQPALDAYGDDRSAGLPHEDSDVHRAEFVERFLRSEYEQSSSQTAKKSERHEQGNWK